MSHQRNRVGVEIEISFAAKQCRIVRLAENKCLRALVVGWNHIGAGNAEGLRLAVERKDVCRVFLRNHTCLQTRP